ncbi:hypothetical protein [Streptomyces sp. NPDC004783]|uniref:hypothetical protein n=1 Tax=Streptomyces sp. NPDC004783 TaxID=3154459 RepID=UPI0033A759CF
MVSVAGDESHENAVASRAVGRLATAVARGAAGRESSEAAFGSRLLASAEHHKGQREGDGLLPRQ